MDALEALADDSEQTEEVREEKIEAQNDDAFAQLTSMMAGVQMPDV